MLVVRVRHLLTSVVLPLVVTACAPAVPVAVPVIAPVLASDVATIDPAGGTLLFPTAAGFGGSFVYSSNDAVDVSVSLSTSTRPVTGIPGPPPPGTVIAAYGFALSRSVRFAQWHRLLTTIALPATFPVTGRFFAEYGYDLTNRTQLGWNPGSVAGHVVSFVSALGPVTLTNHRERYLLVVQ